MARLLLVHGAFGGAWAWEPALGPLKDVGHEAQAIDLPGSGEDETPPGEVTLERYGERICEALGDGEPTVLVGQSMGGIAITQAAAQSPHAVALLVYVAAFAPLEGQSLMDLVVYPEAADDQVQAHMVIERDPPVARLPPDAAVDVLYNCTPPEQARRAAERLGPQPLAPLGPQPLAPLGHRVTVPEANREAFEALPRAYILCRHDRAIPPAMQRRMAREAGCDPVVELDADHRPWMSRPGEFIEALTRIVQARVAQPH